MPLPEIRGQVHFDNVTFGYIDGLPTINHVNLEVRAGEIVALVGHSGAGKTTLMNLLMRFYDPTSGRVKVDGYDLKDVRLETLRRQVSMVAQENVLFSVTLMENIKYGNREATDEQAIAASKAADLHEFVMGLPDGYQTMIGEDGIKLSGGQKQRLALARALVTDPKILILDDVTSALDGETEARVQDALDEVMKGRTTLSSPSEKGSIKTFTKNSSEAPYSQHRSKKDQESWANHGKCSIPRHFELFCWVIPSNFPL